MSKQELLQKAEEVARASLSQDGSKPDEKQLKKVAQRMVKAMPSRALQVA